MSTTSATSTTTQILWPDLKPDIDIDEAAVTTAQMPTVPPSASILDRLSRFFRRSPQSDGHPTRRRPGRRTLVVAAAVTALVLTGGGIAVAAAHKNVTLDVDGAVRHVSTFAGSVPTLLDQQGVAVGERDLVTGSMRDGATITVRHARQLPIVTADGQSTVWTTALTADEALQTLSAEHGDDVALVATLTADGQPQLPLDLTADGSAEIVVDGGVLDVAGDVPVDEALAGAGVSLEPQDEVTVVPAGDSVQVVVVRVVTEDVTTTSEVPFASSQTQDPERTVGTSAVVTVGVSGVRTVVDRVTTADGVERTRETLSDEITTAPVDEVVAVGTKPKPRPTPTPAAPSTGAPSTGGGTAPTPSGSAASLNWAALARCESGGNPAAVSKNGKYYGLYQFSVSTWQSVGGTGLPSQASASEQTQRAQMLYERSGAGQWPACGPRLFT